jgi:prepilin-type N-terminal cleavage/methylation domain-containing protein
MRSRPTNMRARAAGFSLVELAVVMSIVALLLGSLMYTLSAQVEQRNFEDTRRRLEQARELLLSFAIVNGRLPCPATSSSLGAESPSTGGSCTNYFPTTTSGYLPAASIGYQQVDASGYAVDAWGNRIRYAVAQKVTNCSGTSTLPHFTNSTNIKSNGISCQSNDLLVCKSGTATGLDASASPPTCGGSGANQIMATGLVTAIVFSTGKNGSTGGTGTDEAANLDGNALFVFHTATPSTATNGEFDDQFTWITVGELYGKLIAAGVLP